MQTAFAVLWDAFGEFGLPGSMLCDNAFGTSYSTPKTISWFDAQLIRLGISPIHGRPYHPQTQGKVERLHGTFQRELWPTIRRDSLDHFAADLTRFRRQVDNTQRPHEALGDQPPLSRYRPSSGAGSSNIPPAPPSALSRVAATSPTPAAESSSARASSSKPSASRITAMNPLLLRLEANPLPCEGPNCTAITCSSRTGG
jgi:hypothetical protein